MIHQALTTNCMDMQFCDWIVMLISGKQQFRQETCMYICLREANHHDELSHLRVEDWLFLWLELILIGHVTLMTPTHIICDLQCDIAPCSPTKYVLLCTCISRCTVYMYAATPSSTLVLSSTRVKWKVKVTYLASVGKCYTHPLEQHCLGRQFRGEYHSTLYCCR